MTIDTIRSVHSATPQSAQTQALKWKTRRPPLPPTLYLCFGWLLLVAVLAIFADHLSSHSFRAIDLHALLTPPAFLPGGSARHILGTDELGRDLLARLLLSVRISLFVAFVSTIIAAVIGVTLGFIAAWFRAWVEQAIVVLIDVQAAIPFIVVAIGALAFFGNSLTLFAILLGFHGWERIARISRGLALAAWQQGYATSVRDLGASPWRIYIRHILPNIASTLIVAMTLNFPEVILLESGLSFLGLGVQPPLTSLGAMVGFGRDYMQSAPWILLAPSLVIVLTTLSVSMVGDWLRDRLDPTLR